MHINKIVHMITLVFCKFSFVKFVVLFLFLLSILYYISIVITLPYRLVSLCLLAIALLYLFYVKGLGVIYNLSICRSLFLLLCTRYS